MPLHLDKITDPLEISIGNPRCPPATTGKRFGTLAGHIEAKDPRTSKEHFDDLVIVIQLQFFLDSKSSSKGCGQIALSCGGSDQRETRQVDPHRACVGSRIDDDVDLEVFHGGVEVFLDHPTDAVHLVDEEHIALFQFGQKTDQILGLFQHRSTGRSKTHLHVTGNQAGECGLSEPRHPRQQDVIERLPPLLGGPEKHLHVPDHAALPDKLGKMARADLLITEAFVGPDRFGRDLPLLGV